VPVRSLPFLLSKFGPQLLFLAAILSKFVDEFNAIEILLRTNSTFDDDEEIAKSAFELLQDIAEKAEHRMKFIQQKAHLRLLQIAKQSPMTVAQAHALKVIGNLAAGGAFRLFRWYNLFGLFLTFFALVR